MPLTPPRRGRAAAETAAIEGMLVDDARQVARIDRLLNDPAPPRRH